MCSRLLIDEIDDLVKLMKMIAVRGFSPRYNVAPTQAVHAFRFNAMSRQPEHVALRWGLLPPWATELATGNMMINARAETVFQKTSFRNAIRRKRCIVPVNGFYEWEREGKLRRPYLIRQPSNEPFALAGVWEFNEAVPEGPVETFSIITTTANGMMRAIHDRMPVVLPTAVLERWLDPKLDDAGISALLVPAADDVLVRNRVSDYVNNVRNEGPDCIAAPRADEDVPVVAKKKKSKDADGQGMLFG
jgi:putative SOS response-associated peptidase YedK